MRQVVIIIFCFAVGFAVCWVFFRTTANSQISVTDRIKDVKIKVAELISINRKFTAYQQNFANLLREQSQIIKSLNQVASDAEKRNSQLTDENQKLTNELQIAADLLRSSDSSLDEGTALIADILEGINRSIELAENLPTK